MTESDRRLRVPRPLADRARAIAEGRLTPAGTRDAATVILLRPGPAGPETFLLRRTAELDFAPGACVFPGGSVDEADGDPDLGWSGPSPAELAARLGVPADRARALVVAAVRETFEESGVLLAGTSPSGTSPSGLAADSAALAGDRHELLAGLLGFGALLRRRGLVLRADLLVPWARWITPEASPRRFDTWFFAAVLPPGQEATVPLAAERPGEPAGSAPPARPGESESGIWLRPADALRATQAGEMTLLPPTSVTLGELATLPDAAAVLAQHRDLEPRLPRVMVEAERTWLALPGNLETLP